MLFEELAGSPPFPDRPKLNPPFVFARTERVVLGHDGTGRCVDEDQRFRALRVRGCEERAGLPAFAHAHERHAIRFDSVDNGADVVHPRLERAEIARPVREAGSALVEHDQSREGGEALVHRAPIRIGPRKDEIAELRHEHEVVWPVAEGLVRDRDIAASRVLDLGKSHDESVPRDQMGAGGFEPP